MELKDHPVFSKVSEKEQFYKYLRVLFEDLEFVKADKKCLEYQIQELQKDLKAKCSRIKALEDRIDAS